MAQRIGVLLIHGLTGVPSEMRPIEKHLLSMGFDVEIPLLAGHGASDNELLAAKWENWMDSAREGLQNLLTRNDKVVTCGLSMGGTIAAALAAEQPERVAGVAMLSPTMVYDAANMGELPLIRWMKGKFARDCMHILCTVAPVAGRLLYWTETPPYGLKDKRLQNQITKSIEAARKGENTSFGLFRTYFASLRQMNLVNTYFKKNVSKIVCPMLLVHSFEDTIASLRNATNVFCMLDSARYRRLVALTGCDHVLTLDLQRHYVSKLLGEFITELGATGIVEPKPSNKDYGPAVELRADEGVAVSSKTLLQKVTTTGGGKKKEKKVKEKKKKEKKPKKQKVQKSKSIRNVPEEMALEMLAEAENLSNTTEDFEPTDLPKSENGPEIKPDEESLDQEKANVEAEDVLILVRIDGEPVESMSVSLEEPKGTYRPPIPGNYGKQIVAEETLQFWADKLLDNLKLSVQQ